MNNKVLDIVTKTLDDKQAKDITVIDFNRENPFYDYFVVCDAQTHRQINAISNDVVEALAKHDMEIRSIEKEAESPWILIDAFEVVVHIFLSAEREHYNLEKLYDEYAQKVIL